jgi:acetyl-CoA carboxylase biotin carboxylase subunit
MGNKASARRLATECHVPVVPGSEDLVTNEKEGRKLANQMGYPVSIKAAAGGGGKGMRVVHNAVSFAKEFHTAKNEADKNFDNGSVYIEKWIEEPRHIEFQVIADAYGKTLHLGERDCSIQRRYQKLIEESPSSFLDKDLRNKMGKAAVKLAENCKYESLGTVEFLVDKKGKFYFIEMNTRVQVEHTVTEEALGLDLIRLQLQIANKQPLKLEQKDIVFRRHAVECRINAEDSERNFAPCPGEISLYYAPGGNGIRVDSHVYGGYIVPSHYDSVISKIVASGDNRLHAIDRMHRALSEYIIRGINTTVPICHRIMLDPLFREGKINTRYMESFLERTRQTDNLNKGSHP